MTIVFGSLASFLEHAAGVRPLQSVAEVMDALSRTLAPLGTLATAVGAALVEALAAPAAAAPEGVAVASPAAAATVVTACGAAATC